MISLAIIILFFGGSNNAVVAFVHSRNYGTTSRRFGALSTDGVPPIGANSDLGGNSTFELGLTAEAFVSAFGQNSLLNILPRGMMLPRFTPSDQTDASYNTTDASSSDSMWVSRCGITTRAWELTENMEEVGDEDVEEENYEAKEKAKKATANEANPVISLEEYFCGVPLSKEHNAEMMKMWNMIKNRGVIQDLDRFDRNKVIGAITIAYIALHGKTTARSREDCFNRAIGVAGVLGEFEQSLDLILTGILQEVIGDLCVTHSINLVAILVKRFGSEPISLADQYSRLPKFFARKTDYTPTQSESQVQMLVQMSEDPKVLLLRLADRLHTMRFLNILPLDSEDLYKISLESLHVYAPLAHKMGLMKIKGEFEDLSFKHLDPHMFHLTRYTQTAANKAYHDAANSIKEILADDPLLKSLNASFKMTYRIKDRYQLYLKMKRKHLASSNDVRDALGLRIIVMTPRRPEDSEQDHIKRGVDICYYLIERLRHMSGWEPGGTKNFKDYIAGVKENGYQSLHQYIRHIALNTNVEVQVRTMAMHQFAELGEAAHWCYKDLIYRPEIANSRYYKIAWRSPKQLKAESPAELIALARTQLRNARVFVYLEDEATVLNLKKGATSLDAAFSIHTNIGLRTSTIRVQGKRVSFGTVLKTGDVISVECVPDKQQVMAKPSWLQMVTSRQASGALRRYFTDHQKGSLVCLGLVQLLILLDNNRDRVEARYNGHLPDAFLLSRLCKDRTGMTITNCLAQLGTMTTRSETQQLVRKLLDIPSNELHIATCTMALIWARMNDSPPPASDTGDHVHHPLDEIRSSVLHPLIYDILPLEEGGVQNAYTIWCSMIGPNLASTKGLEKSWAELEEEKKQERKQEMQMKMVKTQRERRKKKELEELRKQTNITINDSLHDSLAFFDHRGRGSPRDSSSSSNKKVNVFCADSPKIHIYKDPATGGFRDLYANAPLSEYKRTPRPSLSSNPNPNSPSDTDGSISYVRHIQREGKIRPYRNREQYYRSPALFQIAKKPFSIEASVLTRHSPSLHRFAKRIYANHVNNHERHAHANEGYNSNHHHRLEK